MTVANFSRAVPVGKYGNAKYEKVAGPLLDALKGRGVEANKDLLGDFAVDAFITTLTQRGILALDCDESGNFVAELREEGLDTLVGLMADFREHRDEVSARRHQVRVRNEDGSVTYHQTVAGTFHLQSKRVAVIKALQEAPPGGIAIGTVAAKIRSGDMTARKHLRILEEEGLVSSRIDEKAQGHPRLYRWLGDGDWKADIDAWADGSADVELPDLRDRCLARGATLAEFKAYAREAYDRTRERRGVTP